MGMLINLVGRTLSKCILISNHNDVYFKYLITLVVLNIAVLKYTSIKLVKKKDSLSEHVKSYSTGQGKKELKSF